MFFISCSSLRSDILFWAYILGQFTGWWLSLTNEKKPSKSWIFRQAEIEKCRKKFCTSLFVFMDFLSSWFDGIGIKDRRFKANQRVLLCISEQLDLQASR